MVRERMFGSDAPFCAWMRAHKDLPSYSNDCGFVATDIDVSLHRYLMAVDSYGTREIQAMMDLEVKTRNGEPTKSQRDTLYKRNMFKGQRRHNGQVIRWNGVFFLSMSGTDPDNSESMRWGAFRSISSPKVTWRPVDVKTLVRLLRFEIHPLSFDTRPFRRHHKTRSIITETATELGFKTEQIVVHRS